MKTTPASLPLPSPAFTRLSKEAASHGLSLEAHLDSLTRLGWGIPLATVLATVIEDVEEEIRCKTRCARS